MEKSISYPRAPQCTLPLGLFHLFLYKVDVKRLTFGAAAVNSLGNLWSIHMNPRVYDDPEAFNASPNAELIACAAGFEC